MSTEEVQKISAQNSFWMLIYFDSPQSEIHCKPFSLKCFYVICSNRKEGSQTKRSLRQTIVNIVCSKNRWKTLIQSTENITVPHSVNSLWVINWTLRNWANCRIWDGLFNSKIKVSDTKLLHKLFRTLKPMNLCNSSRDSTIYLYFNSVCNFSAISRFWFWSSYPNWAKAFVSLDGGIICSMS